MNRSDRDLILYGTEQQEPDVKKLSAGALTVELVNGNIRCVTYDGAEVMRAISYIVRDRDWGTYEPVLSDVIVSKGLDSFAVSYTAKCIGPQATSLCYETSISGNKNGNLVFAVTALPDTDFETNRCGFCLLHPIVGLAGSEVTVEHTNGEKIKSHLPDLIDPWQPFKRMRAITHQVKMGVTAECRMEGDTFEMEDQRNWSDASYKTYVRPLELPWPYTLLAAIMVRQTVRLNIQDSRHGAVKPNISVALPIQLSAGNPIGKMPSTGVLITPGELESSLAHLQFLKALAPQHLLFHFDPAAGHGFGTLKRFAELASRSAIPSTLEVALPCRESPATELVRLASMVRDSGLQLAGIVVSPSVDRQSTPPGSKWPDCPPLELVYGAARDAFPGLVLGGGMLSYFTELNRKRVPSPQLDFVTHGTCPLVHAADDVSVMQTLEALPFITRSVRAIYGEKPYRIGPSTIAMRQNPYGNSTKDNPDGKRIAMANCDPRHNGLFAAAWTVGYVARTFAANPEMLTLSALTGTFGLMAGKGEAMPEGGRRPLFHVIGGLAELSSWTAMECTSMQPNKLACVLTRDADSRLAAIMANLTPIQQTIDVSEVGFGAAAQISILDENTVTGASTDSLEVKPLTSSVAVLNAFAVAFLRQAPFG